MKRLVSIAILLVAFCAFIGAQDIKAVTEDGRDVLLHNDGTWGYVDKPQSSSPSAATSTFKAPDTAISKVSSRKAKIAVFYDPTLWTVEKLTGEAAEFQFQLGDSEVYARLIAESETFDLSTVRSGIIAMPRRRPSPST